MLKFFKNSSYFFLAILVCFIAPLKVKGNQVVNEWENHSENIKILNVEEVYEIVNKKNAILIDVWLKDRKPDVLDKKKWLPPKRYTIPGSLWMPNIGRETLTSEQRKYLEKGLKEITKNNKNKKIVFFCRRGYYSKIAAERAIKLGYTNVLLFPGTDLWEDAGQRLVVVKEQNF
tara:strand:+ start:299 stop:820 length:522 start_codon:yes stop_codon:yes gene_type:complete